MGIAKEYGIKTVNDEILDFMQSAVHERLKQVIAGMIEISNLRKDPLLSRMLDDGTITIISKGMKNADYC